MRLRNCNPQLIGKLRKARVRIDYCRLVHPDTIALGARANSGRSSLMEGFVAGPQFGNALTEFGLDSRSDNVGRGVGFTRKRDRKVAIPRLVPNYDLDLDRPTGYQGHAVVEFKFLNDLAGDLSHACDDTPRLWDVQETDRGYPWHCREKSTPGTIKGQPSG